MRTLRINATRNIDPEQGCYGGEYGDLCPFRQYVGGLHNCAITGEQTAAPAPPLCPLRDGGAVVVRGVGR